jgi:hypothetical protein
MAVKTIVIVLLHLDTAPEAIPQNALKLWHVRSVKDSKILSLCKFYHIALRDHRHISCYTRNHKVNEMDRMDQNPDPRVPARDGPSTAGQTRVEIILALRLEGEINIRNLSDAQLIALFQRILLERLLQGNRVRNSNRPFQPPVQLPRRAMALNIAHNTEDHDA